MTEARKLNKEIEAAKSLLLTVGDVVGDDLELLSDTVEGETNLFEAIEFAVKRIQEAGALASGIDEQIKALTSRKSRLKKQAETLRTAVTVAMSIAGKDSMELPTATISRKAVPRGLVIIEEAIIPADYWKPADPKLDRKALLDALKDSDGQGIPGAGLDNGGETLAIRGS